jgi:hypothetical protein
MLFSDASHDWIVSFLIMLPGYQEWQELNYSERRGINPLFSVNRVLMQLVQKDVNVSAIRDNLSL